MSNDIQVIQPPAARELTAFSSAGAFAAAIEMANHLAKSDMVPKEFQGNVSNCVIALELSQRMGVSPLAIMQSLNVIHGRPSFSSSYIIAAVNSSGRFTPIRFDMSEPEPESVFEVTLTEYEGYGQNRKKIHRTYKEAICDRTCIAWALDRTGERLESPPVSLGMAVNEGWYSKPGSKWKTMPDLMLRYRAAAFFGRLYAPDIMMGMKAAEEIGDIIDIDDQGNIIDGEVVDKETGEVEMPKSKAAKATKAVKAGADPKPEEKAKTEEKQPAEQKASAAPTNGAAAKQAETPASGEAKDIKLATESQLRIIRAKLKNQDAFSETDLCERFEIDSLEALPFMQVSDVLAVVNGLEGR